MPHFAAGAAAPDSPTVGLGVISRAGRGALVVYIGAIVYASLSPFFGWRVPEGFLFLTWPRYFSTFDAVLNVLAYIPFGGMLAAMQLRQPQPGRERTMALDILLRTIAAGFALSMAMEALQAFLPVRVSSIVDVLTNTAGTALGAAALVNRWGRARLGQFLVWRYRHFASTSATGWGLLLLGAWFFAQLNPLIPFFEAGHIGNPFDVAAAVNPYEPMVLLPQAVGITLNVCGFSLFLSLLLHPAHPVLPRVLLVLVLGFVIKFAMASLMLKAPQMVEWMGPATIIGLSSGILLFAWFSRIGLRWRAFWATLIIFAGGMMAKITSVYGAFDETLRLFNWPHGHLANFAGLTRWMHESWPLLAVLLSAWIFIRRRQGDGS
jgi:VanZ family protein